jgi:putative ABC transport system permease protein
MRGIVSGIGEADMIPFVIVLLVLMTTAIVACFAPAAKAASVDPMVALREE